MSNLAAFEFEQNQIRVVLIDGEPWFVAKDLCDVLSLGNSRQALVRLDDDEKGVTSIDTLRGMQSLSIVNESGMYSLVLTSRKAEAKAFKKWITSQVLPEIRRTGAYGSPAKRAIEPDWFYRLRLFRRKTKIPVGWFCIFEEIVELMADFEEAGYCLPHGSVPDISVGKCFSTHLKATGHHEDKLIRTYKHYYPDGRVVDARIYSVDLLPEFRRWFGQVYRVDQLKRYLKKKDPKALPILETLLLSEAKR